MLKVLDTNILLDYPQVILNEEDIIIATDVLKELDGLKLNPNSEVAFKARRAAVVISKNLSKIIFNSDFELENYKVDDKLLKIAQKFNGILITNDVYLKINCLINNVATKGYGGTKEYNGIEEWIVELDENGYNEELEKVLQSKQPISLLKENQYLIIKNKSDNSILNIFVYRNQELIEVKYHEIKNKWIGKIKPRPNNPEQLCLFEALYNDNSTIIYAGGPQGVGKSFILNNYALQQLEQQKIRKIVYVPNNAYVENSMELGFLPGDSLEKSIPMIGPLIDLIGMDEVNRLMQDEQLEIIPLAYLRGRNFDDAIVIVNEAQNLSANHVKLLIGRIGNNSRIFFDGSLQQIDADIFKNKNGLRSLLQLSDSQYSDLFSTVRLQKIERSKTAQVADYLDELGGFNNE